MSGICGVYSPTEDVDETLLRRMNAKQHHRGPDSEGFATFRGVGLAAKRLKIIDVETGDQPISNEDGSVTVVSDGAIYNFSALREKLLSQGHGFRSTADTEVVGHLYEEKGERFLEDLNGMFALALWDDRQKRLLIARDRLGTKPLYYKWDGERLLFASEIKGILADESVPRAVDPYALRDYLTFQNVFGDKTLFEGIRILEPGKLLVAEGGRVTVRPYWDLSFAPEDRDVDAFARRYGELLRESVHGQILGGVSVGIHLDGGIESSLVASLAAERTNGLPTFSVWIGGAPPDERADIHTVVETARTDHHEREVDLRAFPDAFPKIMWHLDEPRIGPGVVRRWFLAELARRHVTVVLTGHGGDELFAGHPSYLICAMSDMPGNVDVRRILDGFPEPLHKEVLKRTQGLPVTAPLLADLWKYARTPTFTPEEIEKLLGPEPPTTAQPYDPRRELDKVVARCNATHPLDRVSYLDVKTYLPSLLTVEDRISMAHSLEHRAPILDQRMVELSGRVPPHVKVHGGSVKNIPRRFARTRLPERIANRGEVGFDLPTGSWLRGELRAYVEREILDGHLSDLGLRMEYVHEVVRQHMDGTDRTAAVWSLLSLAVWRRTVVRGMPT